MNGIGLVLAGGGGKGAYQIGVWKYLHECGLDQYVCAVSGTSVGALNAALFASGNYQRAEDLWLNIQPSQILSPKKISVPEIVGWIGRAGLVKGIYGVAAGAATVSMQALAAGVATMLGRRYAFSRDGLIGLIKQGLDFSAIQTSNMPCYATCLAIPECSIRRFDLRQYSEEEATTLLLASSAIPLVFDSEEFRGERYYDGGIPLVGDNVPIKPVYDLGLDCIIVVHLSQDYVIDHSLCPNAKIVEIVPQVNLGGAVDGTLDFTAAGSQWRIRQGYHDAEKVFGMFVEVAKLKRVNELFLQAFQRSEQAYQQRSQTLQAERHKQLEAQELDRFSELCKGLGITP